MLYLSVIASSSFSKYPNMYICVCVCINNVCVRTSIEANELCSVFSLNYVLELGVCCLRCLGHLLCIIIIMVISAIIYILFIVITIRFIFVILCVSFFFL